MSMVAIGSTNVGRHREGNEDALLVDNDVGLFAVCDGMGGHAGGEVASATAVNTIASHLAEHRAIIDRVRAGEAPAEHAADLLAAAIRAAAARIYHLATTQHELAGMGTTVTVLLDLGAKAVLGHVGDSRMYLLRGASIHQMSSDHTMVEQLVRSGAMTLETAKNSPWAHALTRAVGNQPAVQADTLVFDVFAGDRLLMCTDGLSEYVNTAAELTAAISGEFEEIPDALIAVANERGGHDNITVVCVRVDAEANRDTALAATALPAMSLETLDRSFLLEGLSLVQAQRVLNACEVREITAGDTVIDEGAPCNSMFMVLDGGLALSRGGRPVGQVGAGDTVGESALLHERPARACLTAQTHARVLRLPRAHFDELVHRRPWLGMQLLQRVTRRACAAEDRMRSALASAGVEESGQLLARDLF